MADGRRYARLSRRLQASVIDAAICVYAPMAGVVLATWLPEGYGGGPLAVGCVAAGVLVEPILVSRRGTTPGHWWFGLRIVCAATGRPPDLGRSFARYAVKVACLGPWLSPVIAITRDHQGLHDQVANTVVEVIDPASRRGRLAAYDPALDAVKATLAARVISTLGYALALTGAFGIVVLFTVVVCGAHGTWGRAGDVVAELAGRLWFVLMYAVVWLGPAGRLPGARG